MPRTFQAIVFDMDGLLLDSERLSMEIFNQTCLNFDLAPQPELYYQLIGTNESLSRQILQEGFPASIDLDEFRACWSQQYETRISAAPIPLKPGAREFLERVADEKIPAAVATSTATERARRKLDRNGLLKYFQTVVGGDQVSRSKPAPDIYLRAAAELNSSPAECLALEDSENGVRAAVSAGMRVIQVPDLVSPSQELLALGHLILDDLHAVSAHVFS